MQIESDHLNTASTNLDDVGRRVAQASPERSLGHLSLLLSCTDVNKEDGNNGRQYSRPN